MCTTLQKQPRPKRLTRKGLKFKLFQISNCAPNLPYNGTAFEYVVQESGTTFTKIMARYIFIVSKFDYYARLSTKAVSAFPGFQIVLKVFVQLSC